MLGGFISRERSRDRDGLPGGVDIPVLGGLFGVKREQERHTELAIFVTPVIVDPQHPAMAARVANGQGLLQSSFPDAPKLNTPIATEQQTQQWEQQAEAGTVQPSLGSQWEDASAATEAR